jgi:hypothetical protein
MPAYRNRHTLFAGRPEAVEYLADMFSQSEDDHGGANVLAIG